MRGRTAEESGQHMKEQDSNAKYLLILLGVKKRARECIHEWSRYSHCGC